jgi:hypothetical protein
MEKEEGINEQKPERTIEQGENSSKVFSGEENKTQTTVELYGQSAEFFADMIRERLMPNREYKLADLGCYGGELLQNILDLLPNYKFHTIGVDCEKNLENNKSAEEKIVADLEQIPLADKNVNVAISRYTLAWNNAEKQKEILKEISRIVCNFAIIQHAGADGENSNDWRAKFDDLFDGDEVPACKRTGYYFSSREEIEKWMNENKIKFERIVERKVEEVSNVFIERWALNEEDSEKTRKILADKNYVIQTTWLITPNK